MSTGTIIILITLLLISVKLSPYFKLKDLTNLKQLESVKFPDIIPFDSNKNLKDNGLLINAKYIAHQKLHGPETIEFSKNGTMYTGLMNGQIVRIDLNDESIHTVAQFGSQTNETICNDHGPTLLMKSECGRPLGIRITKDDIMYVADSYLGIFKINLSNSETNQILSSNDPRFNKLPLKLLNDLDLDDDDNIIYFIDSSYELDLNQVLEEHLELMPRGRLFSYDEKRNKIELLKDGLYLPNGLQLMPDKQSILINENSMARILRYYLKGEKKGTTEIFINNMPGFGDTIRLTDHNTLLVPFAATRHDKFKSLLDMFGEWPYLRSLMSSVFNLRKILLALPKYGLLAEYDLNGNLLKSWHDSTGQTVECTTNAVIYDKKIYIGSYYNDFIAVIDHE